MADAPPVRRTGSFWAGVAAIAASYVYFLLYAQFGLVFLMESRGAKAADIEHAMGAMGLAGLATSLLSASLLRRIGAPTLLRIGYFAAAAAALAALLLPGLTVLVVIAGVVGAATALITVPLAASLRSYVGAGRLGIGTGLGTGVAYAFCNIPGLFSGTPVVQSVAVALFCAAGFAATFFADKESSPEQPSSGLGSGTLALTGALICFFALVWMDATAFAVIQRTAGLKAHTWEGPARQLLQGGVHLVSALLAGLLIDRGRLRALWPATALLFLISLPAMQTGAAGLLGGPLYAAGISFYSAALVAFPALSAGSQRQAAVRASLVYGIAGWIASGLGVGLAQHLHSLPSWFFMIMAVAILIGWSLSRIGRSDAIPWIPGAVLAALALGSGASGAGEAAAAPEERGRRVYVEEGCMHCHSQYVRPDGFTHDELWWGPARPIDRKEQPPMVGNRRQGPDLSTIGVRRSPDWLKQHFLHPEIVRPGSRMPTYAHLFAEGLTRGDDLIAYLTTRGAELGSEWMTKREAWTPTLTGSADADRGSSLFRASCAGCHGGNGDATGPLAAAFNRPALNLRKGYFQYVPAAWTAEQRRLALARIVKFGIPGTSMAGHEWFPEDDVADLAAWLQSLTP